MKRSNGRAGGLRYANVDGLTVVRRRRGRGFTYLDAAGKRVRDSETIQRVLSLAIPPAYTDVRIAPRADQHIQAVGRDEAGRLQYVYHPSWEAVREARKQGRLAELCAVLPALRRRLARTLRKPGPGREKALAAAVMLIDRTYIRIGNSGYLQSGRSRGAATLLKSNVRCDGDEVHLSFHGKRRIRVECSIRAPALARALRELGAIPGRRLFQYRDEHGKTRRISAGDINAWLQDVTGAAVTAKDFRTLAATAAAGETLCATEPAPRARQRARQVADVMGGIAEALGNTPAVVRRSYVHRRLVDAFERGELTALSRSIERSRELSRGETLVAALLSVDRAASGPPSRRRAAQRREISAPSAPIP